MHTRSNYSPPPTPRFAASRLVIAALTTLAITLTGCATDHAAQAESSQPQDSQSQDSQSENSPSADSPSGDSKQADGPEAKTAASTTKPTAKELRWSRADTDFIYRGLHKQLQTSDLIQKWDRQAASGDAPAVALVAFRNHVTPDISQSIDAVASMLETYLVNDTDTKVLSADMHSSALKEALDKYPDDQHLAALSDFGRTIKLDYVVTGVVTSDVKPQPPAEQVTYNVLVHVIDVGSEEVAFETDFELTTPRQ